MRKVKLVHRLDEKEFEDLEKIAFPWRNVTVDAHIVRNLGWPSSDRAGYTTKMMTDSPVELPQCLSLGYINGTHTEDGKSLPAIVLSTNQLALGENIEAWVCGAIKMRQTDGKETVYIVGEATVSTSTEALTLHQLPESLLWKDFLAALQSEFDGRTPQAFHDFEWLVHPDAERILHESMARLNGK